MVRRDIREDRNSHTIVTRFVCVTVRLLFLMNFHLEFQRIVLWHGNFQKSLQVISQLFELLLSFRCGFSRTVFIISNINILGEEVRPDLAQKPSMIVQKDKLQQLILVILILGISFLLLCLK